MVQTKISPRCKYRPIMLVSIYRYAKLGFSEEAIWEALPVADKTWKSWKKKFPEIKEAIRMGRTETEDGGNWHRFIYDRLPEDLKKIWDDIDQWDELPNGMAKIESLLSNHGKKVRQQLFLYALIHTNFSASRAMAKVCIDKDTLDYWIQNDEGFATLVEEIQWHKGNFFEEHLIGLVKAGDVGATIFANRTFNKDRGYAVKNSVDVNVTGQIEHNLVDLTELELSKEVRMAIMDAMRAHKQKIEDAKFQSTIPVEYRVLEHLDQEIASGAQMP